MGGFVAVFKAVALGWCLLQGHHSNAKPQLSPLLTLYIIQLMWLCCCNGALLPRQRALIWALIYRIMSFVTCVTTACHIECLSHTSQTYAYLTHKRLIYDSIMIKVPSFCSPTMCLSNDIQHYNIPLVESPRNSKTCTSQPLITLSRKQYLPCPGLTIIAIDLKLVTHDRASSYLPSCTHL